MTDDIAIPLCYNCLEPISNNGPRGRGRPDSFALLRYQESVYPFCSVSCRDWWWDIVGLSAFDPDDVEIAEVGPLYD